MCNSNIPSAEYKPKGVRAGNCSLGRIHRQSTMKRLNVNILLSFLNGYSNWSLSKKFGSYVLKFETDTGIKYRIKKFNPPKFDDKHDTKSCAASSSSSKRRDTNNDKDNVRIHSKGCRSRLPHHQSAASKPQVRHRFNSGGGSSEADSLSWDDYDVEAHKRRQEIQVVDEVESPISSTPSITSSCCSSKESSPEMHREGKLLLQEMKELRKEIKKMGDTSVLEYNNYSKDIQLLPTDYSIEELQEMMIKMEEEDRCWDSGYNDKEFSSDKEEEQNRFKEISSEREDTESLHHSDEEEDEVPFDLEEVHSSHDDQEEEDYEEEEEALSVSESLGSSIVLELSDTSKNLAQFIEPISPPISKNQKKKLKRQRAKLRLKNVTRYTAPIAQGPREKRSGWSPYKTARWAHYCANTPTPDKEIIKGMDSILGRETINKDLTPTPIIKGRTVIYKNLFAWEVSFCDTKERYKELLDKKFEEDQMKLQSILDDSFYAKNSPLSVGRSITVS